MTTAVVRYDAVSKIPAVNSFEVVYVASPALLAPDLQKAVDAYKAGESMEKCAAIAGVSKPTLRKRLDVLGIPPRRAMNVDPDHLALAIRAYQEGRTVAECAGMCGIGRETFRTHLKRRGVPLRDQGDAWLSRRIQTPEGLIGDYMAGASVKAVAAKYGLQRSTVYRMLAEAGIDGRDRSQAMQMRWQRATVAERAAMVEKAHAASRGRVDSDRVRATRAASWEGVPRSDNETALGALLAGLGHAVAYGVACGPYNIDIVIAGTVAVEVFGGQWHEHGSHRARFPERARYVLDAGYSLAIVWADTRGHAVSVKCAQHLATLAEIARGHPAIRRQHWVIRGDGHFLAVREDQGGEVPFITASGSRDR